MVQQGTEIQCRMAKLSILEDFIAAAEAKKQFEANEQEEQRIVRLLDTWLLTVCTCVHPPRGVVDRIKPHQRSAQTNKT